MNTTLYKIGKNGNNTNIYMPDLRCITLDVFGQVSLHSNNPKLSYEGFLVLSLQLREFCRIILSHSLVIWRICNAA